MLPTKPASDEPSSTATAATEPATTEPIATVAPTTLPVTTTSLADDSADSPATTAAPDEPPATVTLITAGDQSSTVLLRTAPTIGATWTGTQTVDTQISFDGLGGEPTPRAPVAAIRQTIVVESIDAAGNVTVLSTIDDVTVLDPGELDAATLASYEASVTGMVGTQTRATSDPTGQVIDSEIVATGGADPAIVEAMEQAVGSLASTQFPQPVEPLGIGAEWTLSTQITSQGFTYDVEYRFRLVAIDGDLVTIEVSYVQTPQPTVVVQGVEVEAAGAVTGSGTTRQRIGGVFPIESTLEAAGTITLTAEGDELAMNMEMRMSMLEDAAD